MAHVRVSLREADGGLPDVCTRCGEPSSDVKTRNMSWCPAWTGILILAGLLPYLIVAMILTKRARVQVPFCEKHKGHWFNRTMLTLGTFLLFAAICGGVIFLGIAMENGDRRQGEQIMGLACILSLGLGLAWLIIYVIAQNTAIRPTEITDRDITLTGLSQAFVDAVHAQDYDERPRRRNRDDFDDVDDRPRPKNKKNPPSDAIEESN